MLRWAFVLARDETPLWFVRWPKRPTAHRQAGTAAAAAHSAAGHLRPQAVRPGAARLGLIPNQVWRLTKTDQQWLIAFEPA
jgi:hypothetical protein